MEASNNGENIKHTNIQVCIRVRPLLTPARPLIVKPLSRLSPKCGIIASDQHFDNSATKDRTEDFIAWDVIGTDTLQQSAKVERIAGRTISYTVDRVYDTRAKTNQIYEHSIQPVVRSSLEGYHGSVFAYGQTSTGKTFTMTGTPALPGIVPLAVHDIFQYIQQEDQAAREYLIRFSYLEIYNEQIIDLLSGSSSSVRILEGKDGMTHVRGLREEIVTSPSAILKLIQKGERRRQVGSTNMNQHSSRSHVIARIWIESKIVGVSNKTRASSLFLVDLAGSESVRLTGATGDRRREGQYINKSLMALGQVIFKLSENDTTHIPYRDSKLTRLLQPSLSGNAQIVSICNISPCPSHLEESHNTLKFAMRAKRIQQRVVLNEVLDENTLLTEYKEEIEYLRRQLAEAKAAQKQQQNDDDIRELIRAIQKMEALILKTQTLQNHLYDEFGLGSEDLLTSIDEDQAGSVSSNHHRFGKIPSDQPLLDEMQRIQQLLGAVLNKQGRVISKRSSSVNDLTSMTVSEDEVAELRSQLMELEVTTTLKRADADFLQSQLEQKDQLLSEVAQVLEAVERRQTELECENEALKRMVIDKGRRMNAKDQEIFTLKRKVFEMEKILKAK
jgi:centromeric protein E